MRTSHMLSATSVFRPLMLRRVDTDAGVFQRRKFPADRRGGGHAVQPRHEIAHSALKGSLGIAAARRTHVAVISIL